MGDPYAAFKDADPYAQFADHPSSSKDQPSKQPDSPSLWMSPVGGAEMLLKRATALTGAIPAGLAYGGSALARAVGANVNPADVQRRVQDYLTYQPVTASGQAGEQALSGLLQPVVKPIAQTADRLASSVGQVSPTAESFLREAPSALQAASSILPLASIAKPALGAAADVANNAATAVQRRFAPLPKPEDVLAQSYSNTPQSMGAAAAAPSIANISPELRQAISRTAQRNGGAINPEVLDRHLEAQSLPVKIQLTEGQATQAPALYSAEQNLRGKHDAIATHLNEQNKSLVQNVQALRDQVGPDVFSANTTEHGDTLIDAYKAKDAAASSQIDAAYDAARSAVKDKTASVMNAPQLLADVTKNLHENLLFDSAPSDVMRSLGRLAENNSMSFGNIENLRTNLARIMRSPTVDGNSKYAAGIIRNTLEQAPLSVDDEGVKSLFDQGRALARQRFQAIEADPAYKAAVYDRVSPDKFAKKFVINGNRDDLATMASNLADNNAARQTMSVATIDHLRDAAGIGPGYTGSFKQAGFNRALQGLDGKLSSLVDPKTAEHLQNLGNVARTIQMPPVGHTVNTSNTLTAGMSDYAVGALEHAANLKAGGLPLGTAARKLWQRSQNSARVRQALAPGAGIGKLATAGPPGLMGAPRTPGGGLLQ
jgi:hypothetical protein